MERGNDYTLPYSMINDAFDLPPDTQTTITMMKNGRMPIVEVDDYPSVATRRVRHDRILPPENALVTLTVGALDECDVDWIAPSVERTGALYQGRRAACTMGAAGELIECVEVGS